MRSGEGIDSAQDEGEAVSLRLSEKGTRKGRD